MPSTGIRFLPSVKAMLSNQRTVEWKSQMKSNLGEIKLKCCELSLIVKDICTLKTYPTMNATYPISIDSQIEKHSMIDQKGKPLDSTWRALFTVQN